MARGYRAVIGATPTTAPRRTAGGTRIVCVAALMAAMCLTTAGPARAGPTRATSADRAAPAAVAGLTALSVAPDALNLAFAPDRRDYVIRCHDGQALTFTGTVAPGYRVRAVALGPGAPAPSTLAGSFTYTATPPATTTVRFDVAPTSEPSAAVTRYRVRCLPSGFPTLTTTVTGTPQAAFYVVTHTNWDIVLNAEGTPVWWLNEAPGAPVDAKIIDGQIVTTVPGRDYYVRAWDGTPTRVVHDGLDHHDLQRMPDGDLVGFQYYDSDRGLEEEARFVRLDDAGHEVWSWRTQDHIDAAEMAPDAYKLVWGHANSVEPDGNGRLLVSIRNLDAVYDIDMATGGIHWKLGGTTTPQSLSVFDGQQQLTDAEVLRLFSGQHDARILADGTVSVFDNGTRALARRPRVLRFTIDATARRATLVETVTDARAGYSFGLGSARRTSGGNWVVSWGGWNTFFTELGPNGQPVLTVEGISTYRAVPVEPDEIDAEAMRAGMDAMAGSAPGVTGTVVDAVSGAPVPWAGVAVLRAGDLSLAGAVVADADGNFRAPTDPGSYHVYLIDSSGDHRSAFFGPPTTVTVDRGLPTDVTTTMAPTRGSITGVITDGTSGAPVGGAWAVTLDAATGAPQTAVVADATGHYRFDQVAAGAHKIVYFDPTGAHATAFYAGTPDPTAAASVTVAAGGAAAADIALPARAATPGSAPLTGTITQSGTARPLRGVIVLALRAADYALTAATVTGPTGTYRMDVPATAYKLAFLDASGRHAMEWHDGRPYHGIAEAASVTAPASTPAALDPTTGAVTGTITDDPSHTPLGGAWVVAIGPTGPAGGAVSAADGTYTIDGLAPGTYRVTIVDPTAARRQEYWHDATDFGGATPIAIGAGTTAVASAGLGP